jgi:hypothetical protein
MHSLNLVYGDISLNNIILLPSGKYIFIDYGRTLASNSKSHKGSRNFVLEYLKGSRNFVLEYLKGSRNCDAESLYEITDIRFGPQKSEKMYWPDLESKLLPDMAPITRSP